MAGKFVFLLFSYMTIICNATISDLILNDLRNAFSMVANNTKELDRILKKMFELEKMTPRIVFNIPNHSGHLSNRLKMQHTDFKKPTYPNLPEIKLKRINSNAEEEPISEISQQSEDVYPLNSMVNVKDSLTLWNNNDLYIARANYPFGYSTKWTPSNVTEERPKRGVPALYSMIKCATNCNPAVLQGYGCFCGLLGNGLPVDGVDRCCQNHDKCYGQTKCIKHIEYFVPYLWKCYFGKPICANHHGIWGDAQSCAAKLCECDLKLSYCLRKQVCPQRRSICSSSRKRRIQNFLFV